VKKHQLKAIQSGMLKAGLAEGIQTAADSNGGGNAQFKAMAGKFALNIYTSGLDKSDEFEADRLGVVIAARGGYSPYGLVGVLQTLSLNSQDNAMKLLLATHPSPNDRLDQLAAAMSDKMDNLPNKVDDVPRFAKIKH
jgi:predicted Zn-dependent protease